MLPRPKAGGKGSVYRVDYDIILLLGMTELKAQLAWKEKVSVLRMSFNPTDFRLILRVVFREKRNGKFKNRNCLLVELL